MKRINIVVSAILIKKVLVAVLISVWYAFSKLVDSCTAFLESALIELIKE